MNFQESPMSTSSFNSATTIYSRNIFKKHESSVLLVILKCRMFAISTQTQSLKPMASSSEWMSPASTSLQKVLPLNFCLLRVKSNTLCTFVMQPVLHLPYFRVAYTLILDIIYAFLYLRI